MLVFLPAVCLQVGCAARKPLVRQPEMPPPALVTPEDAVALLLRQYGSVKSFKASGKIEARLPGEKRRRSASLVLMLERPDKLRMRVYRPLAPPVFELVSDGEQRWLFIPSTKTAYYSEGCEPLYMGDNHVPFSAETIIAAVAVLADPAAFTAMPAVIREEEGLARLTLAEKTGAKREIWIDATTGLAARQLLFDADGGIEADITYEKHAVEGDVPVPVAIEVAFPQASSSVFLRIDSFRLNPEIPAGAFEFSPPGNTKIVRPHGENQHFPPE